jgi:hypothetical protein
MQLLFETFRYKNIDGFDKHLRKTINSQPVLYKRHNAFKGYITKAVKLGICKSNPYDEFKYAKGKDLKEPVFLTEEEIKKMVLYEILWVVKFEFATGKVNHVNKIPGVSITPCSFFSQLNF